MVNRVLVDGPASALEAVRHALPGKVVDVLTIVSDGAATSLLFGVDCVFVCQTQRNLADAWQALLGRVPLVILLLETAPTLDVAQSDEQGLSWTDPPCASSQSVEEIRLAMHAALASFRTQSFLRELTGPWLHDARGALGVGQLALKIMEGSADASSPLQKIDNALTRLGWLVERLPFQYALCVGLPEADVASPSVFPTLQSYVEHLRRTQPRRTIDFNDSEATALNLSGQWVPYAAGFAEFAFKLSTARAKLAISVLGPRTILIESECPERPAHFAAGLTMTAADVEAHGSAVPYRLLEVARLTQRTGAALTLEFTSQGFSARVVLPPPGHGQLT